MSTLERYAVELIALLVLAGGGVLWWKLHNAGERRAGAQACIQATTETKATAVKADTADADAQAAQLQAIVRGYDAKIAALSANNVALAQRLRDNAVRAGAVPHPGSPAGSPAEQSGLPESESAVADRFWSIDLAATLDACDANQARVEGLEQTYNDWRQRMLAKPH